MGVEGIKNGLKKYYDVLERGIPKDLPKFHFIGICSEKKNLITTCLNHKFPSCSKFSEKKMSFKDY